MTLQSPDDSHRGLSISLFGLFGARLDGVPVAGFDYNKVRALLAYLAVEHQRPHTRAALCALLWPDLAENAARQNLSQALTRFRQVLGDREAALPLLLTTTDTVRLNPDAPWRADVNRFSDLIAHAERHSHRGWRLCTPCAGTLSAAVALYAGDFLAHLYLSDSDAFEEWALPLRQRLRARMLSALERLSRYAEWRGDVLRAIDIAQRQIDLEPLRDHCHRELIRLLALSGQQSAALAHFDYFRRLLDSELAVEPETATVRLYESVRANPPVDAFRRFSPPPGALPAQPTPLVGRDSEVVALAGRLNGAAGAPAARLLTLTGAPGIGKTRLALEIAHCLRFDFADGLYWVELAPLLDSALLPGAVAAAVGVAEQPRRPVADALYDALRNSHALLVLDNFEHLMDGAPFVATLLSRCPDLTLLVTSRAPLRLRAELQIVVEPLTLPAADAPLEGVAATAAVTLFAQRARAVRPGWTLSAGNVAPVTAICRRLDGLPLAIELIAPRLKSLSAAEILYQFESPLTVAPPGARDMPARHRTLRRAIQWSVERLTYEERALFAAIGLFPGGCTAESVQAVLGDAVVVLPVLESLHDASLIRARVGGGVSRFYQLETLAEFAREMLAESGEADSAIGRQIDYYVHLADAAYDELLGPDQPAWTVRLAAEQDNLRAVMGRAFERGRIDALLRIATGTWRFYWRQGNLREALERLEAGLARAGAVAPGVRSRAQRAAGTLAMGLNDYVRARQLLEDAQADALLAGSVYDHGSARTNLGMVLREQGEFDAACACLESSAALMRTLDRPETVKFPLIILASLYIRLGRIDEAASLYEECLRLNRALGDAEGTANALCGTGSVLLARADLEGARRWCEEGLALYRSLNHRFGMGWSHMLLGDIARDGDDPQRALEAYRQALTIWIEREDSVNAARVLGSVAVLWQRLGDPLRAARLIAAAATIYAGAEIRHTAAETAAHETLRAQCSAALGGRVFAEVWEEGARLSLADAGTVAFPEALANALP